MNEGKTTCGNPSRGGYIRGCRCFMCRQANAQYAYEHAHGANEGKMVGEAETAEARERVMSWQRDGIGLRTIELWTGVSRSVLQTLVSGNHPNCNGLPKRMSRGNYEAIMSACPDRAGHALVDSGKALAALDSMREHGMTYPAIAEASGLRLGTVHSLSYRRSDTVTKATSDALVRAAFGKGGKRVQLEDWQWQEARCDFQHGTDAETIAERYGIAPATVRKHMQRHNVVYGSATGLPRAGRVVEAARGKERFGSK